MKNTTVQLGQKAVGIVDVNEIITPQVVDAALEGLKVARDKKKARGLALSFGEECDLICPAVMEAIEEFQPRHLGLEIEVYPYLENMPNYETALSVDLRIVQTVSVNVVNKTHLSDV